MVVYCFLIKPLCKSLFWNSECKHLKTQRHHQMLLHPCPEHWGFSKETLGIVLIWKFHSKAALVYFWNCFVWTKSENNGFNVARFLSFFQGCRQILDHWDAEDVGQKFWWSSWRGEREIDTRRGYGREFQRLGPRWLKTYWAMVEQVRRRERGTERELN